MPRAGMSLPPSGRNSKRRNIKTRKQGSLLITRPVSSPSIGNAPAGTGQRSMGAHQWVNRDPRRVGLAALRPCTQSVHGISDLRLIIHPNTAAVRVWGCNVLHSSSAGRLRNAVYGIFRHRNAIIYSDLQEHPVPITTNNAIQQDGHFVLDSFSCISPVHPSLVCHITYVSCFVHPADLSRFHQAMHMISSKCRLSCDLSKPAHVRSTKRTSGWKA